MSPSWRSPRLPRGEEPGAPLGPAGSREGDRPAGDALSGAAWRPALSGSRAALRHLEEELASLSRADLLRVPHARLAETLDLCSNDYLGYGRERWPGWDESREIEPSGRRYDASGSIGSRLVTGDQEAHRLAEDRLASWLGTEAALLFTSGYAANVGTLSALVGPGDWVLSDSLNHASIIDGCKLSKGHVKVYPHLAVDEVEATLRGSGGSVRRWVVTESYFSMDGDCPDLTALRAVCDRYDAGLIVDEAHALGVFGPQGRGLCAAAGVTPDVLIATAGKALGLHGAFVAGPSVLRTWLWNRARSFVFSTGVSPVLARAIAVRADLVRGDDERRHLLVAASRSLARVLEDSGAQVGGRPDGPILPWRIGASADALGLARALATEGVHVQAIRPPTVPVGSARLRVTAHALLQRDDFEKLAVALGRLRLPDCFT